MILKITLDNGVLITFKNVKKMDTKMTNDDLLDSESKIYIADAKTRKEIKLDGGDNK